MLHVVEFGEAVRRTGEARVGRDLAHALAVDENLPVVMQRVEKLLAGADGHASGPLALFPQPRRKPGSTAPETEWLKRGPRLSPGLRSSRNQLCNSGLCSRSSTLRTAGRVNSRSFSAAYFFSSSTGRPMRFPQP